MSTKDQLEIIQTAGIGLRPGSHTRIACPFCNPPPEDSECMRLVKLDNEAVTFKCWRASCGERGTINSAGQRIFVSAHHAHKSIKRVKPPRLYTEPMVFAERDDLVGLVHPDHLASDRCILNKVLKSENDLVFSIRGLDFSKLGYVVRRDNGAEPRTYEDFNEEPDKPWYHFASSRINLTSTSDQLIIVEDYLSAEIVKFHTGIDSLALLGARAPQRLWASLLIHRRFTKIVVALDPGAYKASFAIWKQARDLGYMAKLKSLPDDPKRMSRAQLLKEFCENET